MVNLGRSKNRFGFPSKSLKWWSLVLSQVLCIAYVALFLCMHDDGGSEQKNPVVKNTQEITQPFTSPQEALAAFKLPEGFSATVCAAEPDVRQPIAMTFDHRGRLWVVENYTYGDSNLRFDRSVNDRVLIFEDTDNDGQFDVRKVFWDQSKLVTGIEIGVGGVWLTAAPEMIFIPDHDRDDAADGPAQTILVGFDDEAVGHNIVNGLRWGPDGWLYGRHGIMATSAVGLAGSTAGERQKINCGIWRYHPIHGKFEIVAQGSTNPWGWDYDQYGEMFMINTVIGHLFHVVPGARFSRMYGAHENPFTYQVIKQTADHVHWAEGEHWATAKKGALSSGTDAAGGGHAHSGLMIYQGGAWPESYNQTLMTLNFHGRRINQDHIKRSGNSYVAAHGKDDFFTSDPWFRGVELRYGPDGNVFVLDWSDIGECHENDGVHRSSGRIFKLSYADKSEPTEDQSALSFDLSKFSEEDLLKKFFSTNQWWVRSARRELVNRHFNNALKDATLLAAKKMWENDALSVPVRLAAVWFLYSIDKMEAADLVRLSHEDDPHLRSWAVRLLGDGLLELNPASIQRLKDMAANDPSGLVRMYIASGLDRLKPKDAFVVASNLLMHEQDANDRVQPHLIWFRVEPLLMPNLDAAVSLARSSQIPLVRKNIARRMAAELENQPTAIEKLLRLATSDSLPVRRDILEGLSLGLEGWSRAEQPASWPVFVATFSEHAKLPEAGRLADAGRIEELSRVFGEGRTIDSLLKIALDRSVSVSARKQAISSLGKSAVTEDQLISLKPLLTDRDVAVDLLKSMTRLDSQKVPEMIFSSFVRFRADAKSAAIDTLTARPKWAKQLLETYDDGMMERGYFTAWHARQVTSFENQELTALLAKVWGAVRQTSKERRAEIATMSEAMTEERLARADLENGQRVFEQVCGSCHRMFAKGGRIGPELTGANRSNLNYLLENILDPSASLATSFRSSLILLDDGRLVTGVVIEETDRIIGVQTKDEIVKIDKTTIEERRLSDQSLMPDGLLTPLTEQQRVDLISWLMKAGK